MTPKLPPKSLVAVLKLSPDRLTKFPHVTDPSADASTKSSSSANTPPATKVIEPSPAADTPVDTAATPAPADRVGTPSSSLAPPAASGKRKGPAPKAGTKRSAAALTPNNDLKSKSKPGPKKKQKLGDMINDPNSKTPFAAPTPLQKLGPKANQGAINAGLRALDRTGKPCRKWEKKGFQVRSFTGVGWTVPTWRAPNKAAGFAEDVKSDSTGSTDSKVKEESSAVSDKSGVQSATPLPPGIDGIAHSPAPVATAS